MRNFRFLFSCICLFMLAAAAHAVVLKTVPPKDSINVVHRRGTASVVFLYTNSGSPSTNTITGVKVVDANGTRNYSGLPSTETLTGNFTITIFWKLPTSSTSGALQVLTRPGSSLVDSQCYTAPDPVVYSGNLPTGNYFIQIADNDPACTGI